ncbi:MAG: MGMT family protein [Spirochaetales bacterium]|nr:MGMT family protein [Spirochaetales bacterium]
MRIARVIRAVPRGRVATYGQIAALAGNPRAARAVVWVLRRGPGNRVEAPADGHDDIERRPSPLPWHRVINSQGKIALPRGDGFELQRALLLDEGVSVTAAGRIDLERWLWRPDVWDITHAEDGDTEEAN